MRSVIVVDIGFILEDFITVHNIDVVDTSKNLELRYYVVSI